MYGRYTVRLLVKEENIIHIHNSLNPWVNIYRIIACHSLLVSFSMQSKGSCSCVCKVAGRISRGGWR